jgi:hypothetical protein
VTGDLEQDFAPIATRIRKSLGRQGFMAYIGAQLCELTRGARLPSTGVRNYCSSMVSSTAASPPSWSTMQPRLRRRPRAASRR